MHTKNLTLALAVEMVLTSEVTMDSAHQFAQKAFKTHVVDKKAKAKSVKLRNVQLQESPVIVVVEKVIALMTAGIKKASVMNVKKKRHIAKACHTCK